jgi:predicted GNAT superfamily acetyltransferase
MMPVLSDDPVHAGWALTRNESVLCRSHSVAVHDQRMKSGVSIVKMDSKKSRIFAGISL